MFVQFDGSKPLNSLLRDKNMKNSGRFERKAIKRSAFYVKKPCIGPEIMI